MEGFKNITVQIGSEYTESTSEGLMEKLKEMLVKELIDEGYIKFRKIDFKKRNKSYYTAIIKCKK